MSLLFLLPLLAVVAILIAVFLWSLRVTRRTTAKEFVGVEADQRHATQCPQIRQALDVRDFEYLRSAGGRRLVQRVRRERRRVVIGYLDALGTDFEQLLRLARAIAVLSPEVVAVQEFERLRLTLQFRWRRRIIQLQLLFGTAALPQVTVLSDLMSSLAVRLETAMTALGERAALAVELASAPDRHNLNAV